MQLAGVALAHACSSSGPLLPKTARPRSSGANCARRHGARLPGGRVRLLRRAAAGERLPARYWWRRPHFQRRTMPLARLQCASNRRSMPATTSAMHRQRARPAGTTIRLDVVCHAGTRASARCTHCAPANASQRGVRRLLSGTACRRGRPWRPSCPSCCASGPSCRHRPACPSSFPSADTASSAC